MTGRRISHAATIDDVARIAGVSVATVSRALRGLPNVADATRQRVLEVAGELNYSVNPQASRLASGRMSTVGLLTPLFDTYYSSRVMAGVEDELATASLDLLIRAADTPERREAVTTDMRSLAARVDGLITVDYFGDAGSNRAMVASGVPVVTIGEEVAGASSILVDNVSAAADASRHLLQLGHRRIALMTGTLRDGHASPVPGLRHRGYVQALGAEGIDADPVLEVDGEFSIGGGVAAMSRLLDLEDPPTAVFVLSDEMALGALHELGRRRLQPGVDLSVVGFDDHQAARVVGLTTMAQPMTGMGRSAVVEVLRRVASPDAEPSDQMVAVTLVVRSSTGPAPHRG